MGHLSILMWMKVNFNQNTHQFGFFIFYNIWQNKIYVLKNSGNEKNYGFELMTYRFAVNTLANPLLHAVTVR